MKISTKGRYALEAVLDLAIHANERHESLKEVSERRDISETYLEQIFVKLKKHGIVESIRGAQGGYKVARSIDEITVGDIIRAVEGPLSPVKCLESEAASGSCEIFEKCITKTFWGDVTDVINSTLDNVTLRDLVERVSELKANVVIDYFI